MFSSNNFCKFVLDSDIFWDEAAFDEDEDKDSDDDDEDDDEGEGEDGDDDNVEEPTRPTQPPKVGQRTIHMASQAIHA